MESIRWGGLACYFFRFLTPPLSALRITKELSNKFDSACGADDSGRTATHGKMKMFKYLLSPGVALAAFATILPAHAVVLSAASYGLDGGVVPGPGTYSTPSNYNSATFGALPSPSIHVAINTPNPHDGSLYQGGVRGTLSYYYHISGPATPSGFVATTMATSMALGGAGVSPSGFAIIDGSNISETGICWPLGACGTVSTPTLNANSQSLTRVFDELMPVDGQIGMTISGYVGNGSFSGFIDPVFTVPVGYSISFSPGIGNGFAVGPAVPEPASMALLSVGLMGLGVLRYRKKI